MRIIAGEFRGRKLLPPQGQQTRPITDRVKQSLFDILAPSIEGAVVFDCFAGTGSLGLEALSRGASRAVFFEQDRSAVRLLQENIRALGVSDRAKVVSADLFRWFEKPEWAISAGMVFLDPPYRFLSERSAALQSLGKGMAERHLAAEAIVVFRHDAGDRLELPPLVRYDEREYGGMTLEFLRRGDV